VISVPSVAHESPPRIDEAPPWMSPLRNFDKSGATGQGHPGGTAGPLVSAGAGRVVRFRGAHINAMSPMNRPTTEPPTKPIPATVVLEEIRIRIGSPIPTTRPSSKFANMANRPPPRAARQKTGKSRRDMSPRRLPTNPIGNGNARIKRTRIRPRMSSASYWMGTLPPIAHTPDGKANRADAMPNHTPERGTQRRVIGY